MAARTRPTPVSAKPAALDPLAKARAARAAVDPKETPEARFTRLANRRFPAAVEAINKLISIARNSGKAYEGDDKEKAGTSTGYAHTKEDAQFMLATLVERVRKLGEEFNGGAKKKDGADYTLPSQKPAEKV